jgi:hypothetical protein
MGFQTGSILKRAMEIRWPAGVERRFRILFIASRMEDAGAKGKQSRGRA